ncbi:MAG: GAF domain-containing protein [Dehalococcoidia bacterium]
MRRRRPPSGCARATRSRLAARVGQSLSAALGLPVGSLPVGLGGPHSAVLAEQRIVHIHGTPDEIERDAPDTAALMRHAGRTHHTALGAPLLRESQAVGMLTVNRPDGVAFSERQIALLQTFTDQAVIAMENVRLFQEIQQKSRDLARSVEQLQGLGAVTQAVTSTLDLDDVLQTIVRHAQAICRTDDAVIFQFEPQAQEFHLQAQTGIDAEVASELAARSLRLGEGTAGQAGLLRQPVQLTDIAEDAAYSSCLRNVLLE